MPRQPGTDAIENSQIRLTDGSIIFTFCGLVRAEDLAPEILE